MANNWKSPDSASLGAGWNGLSSYVIDNNLTTNCLYSFAEYFEYSTFITFTPSTPQYSDKVRYYVHIDYSGQIDVDAYYGGSWHDIFTGVLYPGAWIEKSLPSAKLVSQFRVRLQCDEGGQDGYFYEFQYNLVAPTKRLINSSLASGKRGLVG